MKAGYSKLSALGRLLFTRFGLLTCVVAEGSTAGQLSDETSRYERAHLHHMNGPVPIVTHYKEKTNPFKHNKYFNLPSGVFKPSTKHLHLL